jgi:hypothetical protein
MWTSAAGGLLSSRAGGATTAVPPVAVTVEAGAPAVTTAGAAEAAAVRPPLAPMVMASASASRGRGGSAAMTPASAAGTVNVAAKRGPSPSLSSTRAPAARACAAAATAAAPAVLLAVIEAVVVGARMDAARRRVAGLALSSYASAVPGTRRAGTMAAAAEAPSAGLRLPSPDGEGPWHAPLHSSHQRVLYGRVCVWRGKRTIVPERGRGDGSGPSVEACAHVCICVADMSHRTSQVHRADVRVYAGAAMQP